MGDTIKQAIGTLSAGSAEFKRALKVLIKYEIHCLLQRLSDTGEEAIVITTSVEDGVQEHLGTSKGEGFLRHTQTVSQLKEQFRQYCTDDLYEDLRQARSKTPDNCLGSQHKNCRESKSTIDDGEAEASIENSLPEHMDSIGLNCPSDVQKDPEELLENKPMDFSWKFESAEKLQRLEKASPDFTDRANIKASSGLENKEDRSAYLYPSKCKLPTDMPTYMCSSATGSLECEYEDSEVQDLSIHQRGTSYKKTENLPMCHSRKKRKSSKVSDQDCLSNGGLCNILPKHSESLSVIPRCHFDLSVSQIVENLSKAVQDKWTEDSSELSEMDDSGLIDTSVVDKGLPVYFKCTESPTQANDEDFPDTKTVANSKEVLSWQREEVTNKHCSPGSFENWEPVNLKRECTDSSDLYKTNEQKESPTNRETYLLSEVKLEPDCGKACSDYDAANQTISEQKHCNQSGAHGSSPIQLNFICRICGQNFRNRQYRDFHVKLHKSAHSFLCNLCSAGFNSEAECNEHQKLHTDPVYQCDSCGYRCTREFRMRAHKEICGEPAKIYKCPYCDKQFAAQRYMRIHMKSHDTKNVHTCPFCQNTYPLKNSLLKHMKKKHSA